MKRNSFPAYAWGVLGFNLLVILWGVYVRATGSGAGYGGHWPLCNGEVVPRAPTIQTIIEFTHRITSGIALILVAGLPVWAFRRYPPGHPARSGSVLSAVLIVSEALLGAGLVLFDYVAGNASVARAFYLSAHLINTLLLLGALTLTAWWASGGAELSLRGHGRIAWRLGLGALGILFLGMSGVVAALGDTLFPPSSLAAGLRQDFSPAAHFLLRLRVLHPVIALCVGGYLVVTGINAAPVRAVPGRSALLLTGVVALQLGAGMANIILLAPWWMQIVHLLLADFVWIAFVLLSAQALSHVVAKPGAGSPAATN
ncbi:MAG: COX15/CtaA family protein [Acidobacteria bacterium]|nr:COX15/CtaA family protein [Acidobacteriota bacterium]